MSLSDHIVDRTERDTRIKSSKNPLHQDIARLIIWSYPACSDAVSHRIWWVKVWDLLEKFFFEDPWYFNMAGCYVARNKPVGVAFPQFAVEMLKWRRAVGLSKSGVVK